jgi:hypothetical protein
MDLNGFFNLTTTTIQMADVNGIGENDGSQVALITPHPSVEGLLQPIFMDGGNSVKQELETVGCE